MPRRIWILWALFLIRGAFYCAMLPLWEGWDEYAHFAILQHWIHEGTLPRFEDPVSHEIDESMRLAPLADELRWLGPPYLTEEQWWALPARERDDRAGRLASLPPAWAREPAIHKVGSYESQQPPLYYWIASLPLRWIGSWPLVSRVLFMRLFSLAIASCAIPLTWLAARSLLGSASALMCAALLAVAPGFAIDVARVANDCLAISISALILLLLIRSREQKARGLSMGVALGAALLAKVYLITLIPVVITVWFRERRRLAAALLAALALAGWWYARNLAIGHSVSGWQERAETRDLLTAVTRINWIGAAQVIAKSFIWFGGWSFLTLRSWMYTVVEAITAIAVILALRFRRNEASIPFVLSACWLPAMAYGELVEYAIHGIAGLPGWYMWPIAGGFAMILAAGLRRFSIVMVAVLAVLDLYGAIALMAPYYAGLAERNRAAGSQFFHALARLHVGQPVAIAWILATLAIPVLAVWPNKNGNPE